jgi:N-acetyl-gamma-glutamylphosphate reductase
MPAGDLKKLFDSRGFVAAPGSCFATVVEALAFPIFAASVTAAFWIEAASVGVDSPGGGGVPPARQSAGTAPTARTSTRTRARRRLHEHVELVTFPSSRWVHD